MECFNCHSEMQQSKSAYGFYYRCPRCGRKFETTGQTIYNSSKYKNRIDSRL